MPGRVSFQTASGSSTCEPVVPNQGFTPAGWIRQPLPRRSCRSRPHRRRPPPAARRRQFSPPTSCSFSNQTTLVAQRFDVARMRPTGEPVRVAENVQSGPPGLAAFDASPGVVTYRQPAPARLAQLTWLDRDGKTIGHVGDAGPNISVSISPDGRFALADQWDEHGRPASGTVTRIDIQTGAATRLFMNAASPVWSPDGSRVVFTQFRRGRGPMPTVATLDGGGQVAAALRVGPSGARNGLVTRRPSHHRLRVCTPTRHGTSGLPMRKAGGRCATWCASRFSSAKAGFHRTGDGWPTRRPMHAATGMCTCDPSRTVDGCDASPLAEGVRRAGDLTAASCTTWSRTVG